MLKEWWEGISRVDASSGKGQFVFVVMAMIFVTLVSLVNGMIVMAGVFWIVFLFFALLRATVIEKAGNALITTGGSTPSVAQHSEIETMVARGRLREAAEAYRAVIEADARDLVACDKLGQLALRELKDYELAIHAYREAEQRASEPQRKLGYALLALGIWRDNIGDDGRTVVEIRKLLARFPGAPNAPRLRAEIDELKARHFEVP